MTRRLDTITEFICVDDFAKFMQITTRALERVMNVKGVTIIAQRLSERWSSALRILTTRAGMDLQGLLREEETPLLTLCEQTVELLR